MRVLKGDQTVVTIIGHTIREEIHEYRLSEEEYEHFKKIKGNKNKEEYIVDADRTSRYVTINSPYRIRFEVKKEGIKKDNYKGTPQEKDPLCWSCHHNSQNEELSGMKDKEIGKFCADCVQIYRGTG